MLLTALTSDGLWWVTFRWTPHDWAECGAPRSLNHAVFTWQHREGGVHVVAPLRLMGETVGDETAWMLTVASVDDLLSRRLPIVYCQPCAMVTYSDEPSVDPSSSSSRVHDEDESSSSSSSSVE